MVGAPICNRSIPVRIGVMALGNTNANLEYYINCKQKGAIMDKRYSIEEVFEILGEDNLSGNYDFKQKEHSVIVDGCEVDTRSLRYMTFYQKGTTCACCGRKGSYFKLNEKRKRFDLYCDDGMLITKGSIFPKSLGGLDNIANMQPMCMKCNGLNRNGIKNLVCVDRNGNKIRYKNISSAVLSLVKNIDKKEREQVVIEILEKADAIRYSVKSGTYYRGSKWYIESR